MNILTNIDSIDLAYFMNKVTMQKRKVGNPGTGSKIYYKDIICSFDIESTGLPEIRQSFMYVWQFQFGEYFTLIGRTWNEYLELLRRLTYFLDENQYLCIFVHNLSYEFQFLKGVYDFKKEEVFAVKPRKVLKCTMFEHFEYRCSYFHSNTNLAAYTKQMGVKNQKKQDFSYTKKRFQDTDLTSSEMEYIVNDVLGLVQALNIDMSIERDNLYTFPLTSTGYVRRDVKKAMKKVSRHIVASQYPSIDVYKLLREAFRGGDTHANRFYAGKVLTGVKSYDRVSSYPEVMCNLKFPIEQFKHVGAVTPETLMKLIYKRHKACLFQCSILGLELIDKHDGVVYLSTSKCRNIKFGIYDNGRILEAEYLETTLTDIDLKILLNHYKFKDLCIFNLYHSRYGKLPKPIREQTIRYYELKTKLKGLKEEELYYMLSKNKLNGIYGMMAQDPVKQTIDFLQNEFIPRKEDEEYLLTKHFKNAFLCYQWGVWVTAHARNELDKGLLLAGEGAVYWDTDSVKYVGDVDWREYNKDKENISRNSGAFAEDRTGNIFFMGPYERDGEYDKFKTLGAKKYAFEKEGKTYTTIAGVNKMKGGIELHEQGGVEEFKEGFTFSNAGGNTAVYNDIIEPFEIEYEGRKIQITSNVFIENSTYRVGITEEYRRLIFDGGIC